MRKINKLKKLLTKKEQFKIGLLIVLIFISSFMSVVGIGSLVPFTAIFFNESNELLIYFDKFFETFGLYKYGSKIHIYGFFTIFIFVVSQLLNLVVLYFQSKIIYDIENNLKNKLFNKIANFNLLEFVQKDLNFLQSIITLEVPRLSHSTLIPLAIMASNGILILFIIFFLLILNSKITVLTFLSFSIIYFTLFRLFNNKLKKNNKKLTEIGSNFFNTIDNFFKLFREVKIYGYGKKISNHFKEITFSQKKINIFSIFLASSPRYFVELFSITSLIILMIIYDKFFLENKSLVLTFLFAFYKLLPSLQNFYSNSINFKINNNSINSIYDAFLFVDKNFKAINEGKKNKIDFQIKSININNLSFAFGKRKIFDDIKFQINVGEKVGIIGENGSGKTTFINLILGLLTPEKGEIVFNNQKDMKLINYDLSKIISYVPQNCFLINGTIRENIVFFEEFNEKKYFNILEKLELNSLFNKFDNFDKKKVHSTNLNLSGGELQKIGLARALYRNPSILILDESFNQIDKVAEENLLNQIFNYSKEMIIIYIFHKQKNNLFDKLYKVENNNINLFIK